MDKIRSNITVWTRKTKQKDYVMAGVILTIIAIWIGTTPDLHFISKLGMILSVAMSLLFIVRLGSTIPVRELVGFMLFLQLVLAPSLIYNYLDNETRYPMEVDEVEYLNFALWAVIACLSGLFVKLKIEKINVYDALKTLRINNQNYFHIGLTLVVVGVVSGFLQNRVPYVLRFVLFLMSTMQFIGAFYILFSNNRFKLLWALGIFGVFTMTIIGQGVFVKLFEWGMYFFIVFTLVYRINFTLRLSLFLGGFLLIFFVQTFKKEYREEVWEDRQAIQSLSRERATGESKQEIFLKMAREKSESEEELYTYDNMNTFISRYNQGWIFTKVLNHVPYYQPFTLGETMMVELRAAIVPRILDPNKPTSGGKYGDDKFLKFTGKELIGGTRMTIGTMGDGYVNFGHIGGIIYMFAFGLFVNLGLSFILNLSRRYPSLILWIPFIFMSVMRAGTETLVILNHITKSSVIVFALFFVFRRYFRAPALKENSN